MAYRLGFTGAKVFFDPRMGCFHALTATGFFFQAPKAAVKRREAPFFRSFDGGCGEPERFDVKESRGQVHSFAEQDLKLQASGFRVLFHGFEGFAQGLGL